MSKTRKSGVAILGWSMISKVLVMLSSIVLARLLFPEDYGYMAVAMLFDGFFNLFTITGFETYYVQKRDLSPEDDMILLGKVFFLRIRQSIVLFVLQLGLGIGLYFFKDQTLGWMLMILSTNHLLNLVGKPEETYLTKRIDLTKVALSNFLRDTVSSVAKIGFAYAGFGALSFVIGQTIGVLPRIYILKKAISLEVKVVKQGEDLREIFKFGQAVFMNTVGAFLTSQADSAILAAFYPKRDLGLYQFARKQSSLLFNIILAPLASFILSYISKLKQQPDQLNKKFDAIGLLIMYFITPGFVFLMFHLREFVVLVFSDKWVDSIDITQIFLFYYIIQFITYPSGYILTAIGKPGIKAKISWGFSVFMIISFFLMAYLGSPLWLYATFYALTYTVKDTVVGIVAFKHLEGGSFVSFVGRRFKEYPYLAIMILSSWGISELNLHFIFSFLLFIIVMLAALYVNSWLFKSKSLEFSLDELALNKYVPVLKRFKLLKS